MDNFINYVAERLRNDLPSVVTKEQLMNHYIHKLSLKFDAGISVLNLICAANSVGIEVKGRSRLQVNTSVKEQVRFIAECNPKPNRAALKAKINLDKERLIAAYENGTRSADLAKVYGCAEQTINYYLRRFGCKMRRRGHPKMNA